MGVQTNRMLLQARSCALAPATETTIFGVGREGILNGGSVLVVTVDGTGDPIPAVLATTGIVTVTIYYRATPSAELVADATTVAVPIAGKRQIQITGPQTGNYEIVMKATVAAPAAAAESVVVSSLTTRGV